MSRTLIRHSIGEKKIMNRFFCVSFCVVAGFTMAIVVGHYYFLFYDLSLNIRIKNVIENRKNGINLTGFMRISDKDNEDTPISSHRKRIVITKTVYPLSYGDYILNNPNLCNVNKVSLVVMVHTAPEHFKIRSRMRRTWLNSTHYSPERVVTIFLLGTVTDNVLQEKIMNESKEYNDIVQGNFLDSYRNLTHKGVLGYRWITEHCRNAELMVKVDDDAIINFFKLFQHHKQWMVNKRKHILCNKINSNTMPILRYTQSPWYVQPDQYKDFSYYPHTYCSGFVVFISMDLVPLLYQAAKGTPFFWVDDFFLFGVLPSKVEGVTFTNFRGQFTLSYPAAYRCYSEMLDKCQYFVMPAREELIYEIWGKITKGRKKSKYGNFYMHFDGITNKPNTFKSQLINK